MPFFRRGLHGSRTRIYFATDVHGSERTWRKFVNAAAFYKADVLVMGGDVMGKLAIPIIEESGGKSRATIHGRVERFETEAEVQSAERRIRDLGFYDIRMTEDDYRSTQADESAVDDLFHRLAVERLQRWVSFAGERLRGSGVRLYATGGNDDLTSVMEEMAKLETETFIPCEGRTVPIDDSHVMISMPYVNPTPWKTPREASESELATRIDDLAAELPDQGRVIFNFHAPPKDSTLDTCPMLDDSFDPPRQVVAAGQPVLYGAGSVSVRRSIESYQPLLGLHGHIHEAQAATSLGRTLCVNPGSEYGEGVLRGCLITLAEGRVDAYQMTTG